MKLNTRHHEGYGIQYNEALHNAIEDDANARPDICGDTSKGEQDED